MINNNPLPDITHEEFVSLLGPVLVPENYAYLGSSTTSPPGTPNSIGCGTPGQARRSISATSPTSPSARLSNSSPAPMDWIHFEGRSVKTTLSNMVGLDGLARERKWRSHCVFSLDACKVRQGIEAVSFRSQLI